MEEPRIGDRRKDQTGVEWIYAGKAGWRRVVTPERQWNDLTDDEIAKSVGSPLDEVYLEDFRAVIATFKEKNQ